MSEYLQVGQQIDSDNVFIATGGGAYHQTTAPLSGETMHILTISRKNVKWLVCALLRELSDDETAVPEDFDEDVDGVLDEFSRRVKR